MVGPRCFCAHGLRVEKGVQLVRLTERKGTKQQRVADASACKHSSVNERAAHDISRLKAALSRS